MQYTIKLRTFISLTLTIVVMSVFFMLGVWQLHRAAFKRELQSQYEIRRHAAPRTLTMLGTPTENVFSPLRVVGHYDRLHVIVVGNKIYQHQAGSHIVLPFFPEGSVKGILVDQGWVPQGQVQALTGEESPFHLQRKGSKIEIVGLIQYPQKSFMLGENVLDFHWPLHIQQLDVRLLSTAMHTPLYPFVLLLSPEMPEGFVREWAPVSTRPEMHLGYAIQWFAMGIAFGIYVLVIGRRKW